MRVNIVSGSILLVVQTEGMPNILRKEH
ncbi:uncharacterized protein Dyak_GE27608 [Drosophila yakuba]|uniref:Uncharacterized protein n=1 Tax=Drosophila yakuba TaxID=7245 RepID=A0A0R1E7J4_DROYA|nr:uncharacterized protein Dyak_GE27608 [Drosophila yakuba]